MRRWLPAVMLLAITGCSWTSAPSMTEGEKQTRNLSGLLAEKADPSICTDALRTSPPKLLDITAYGLEGDLWWSPGRAYKVNWMAESSHSSFTVRLRKQGRETPAYSLDLHPTPSTIQFPAAGCWELTLERQGEAATVMLSVRPDRPTALALGRRSPGSRVVGEPSTESDLPELLRVLEKADWSPVPSGRQGVPLGVVWQSGWEEPAFFIPGFQGQEALLVVRRAFLTGECHKETGYVAVSLPQHLAGDLTTHLALREVGMADMDLPAWGLCQPFAEVR